MEILCSASSHSLSSFNNTTHTLHTVTYDEHAGVAIRIQGPANLGLTPEDLQGNREVRFPKPIWLLLHLKNEVCHIPAQRCKVLRQITSHTIISFMFLLFCFAGKA